LNLRLFKSEQPSPVGSLRSLSRVQSSTDSRQT
jgi:hypothetical protein